MYNWLRKSETLKQVKNQNFNSKNPKFWSEKNLNQKKWKIMCVWNLFTYSRDSPPACWQQKPRLWFRKETFCVADVIHRGHSYLSALKFWVSCKAYVSWTLVCVWHTNYLTCNISLSADVSIRLLINKPIDLFSRELRLMQTHIGKTSFYFTLILPLIKCIPFVLLM